MVVGVSQIFKVSPQNRVQQLVLGSTVEVFKVCTQDRVQQLVSLEVLVPTASSSVHRS